ncbi:hypothetical protein HDV00_010876 [Rhizophlyctis rosea]|nr:hypothetical protein HDV00_010876 [Rhizophlyctis rosea]
MKKELLEKNKKIEDLQQEVLGTNFTPYSIPGKKLLAKLRALQQENEELGKQLSQGKVEQLQVELSLERQSADELKATLEESNQLVVELDSEAEIMQVKILNLQARLEEYEKRDTDGQTSCPRSETGMDMEEASHGGIDPRHGEDASPVIETEGAEEDG